MLYVRAGSTSIAWDAVERLWRAICLPAHIRFGGEYSAGERGPGETHLRTRDPLLRATGPKLLPRLECEASKRLLSANGAPAFIHVVGQHVRHYAWNDDSCVGSTSQTLSSTSDSSPVHRYLGHPGRSRQHHCGHHYPTSAEPR